MRVRAGTAAVLTGTLVTGLLAGLLATPSFGADVPVGGSPVPTGTPTPTTQTPTSTVTGNPTTTPTTRPGTPPPTTTTTTPCYTYTPPATRPPGSAVATFDFENGTTQGWSGSGGPTVENTDELAASGTRSLRVSGLTTSNDIYAGIYQLPDFGWYKVTAKVRVKSPQPSAQVVLRASTYGSSTLAGYGRAGADGWTEVTAYFRPGVMYMDWYCNGTMTGTQAPASVQLRLALDVTACGQYIDRPATLYLDDVVVTTAGTGTATPVTPPPSPTCGTTSPPPPPPCQVTYRLQSQWPGGYQAVVDVRDAGGTARPAWTLSWTFPDDQKIQTLWGASYRQTGREVTVTAPPWSPLGAGGTVSFGFIGTSTAAPAVPPVFALDGATCG